MLEEAKARALLARYEQLVEEARGVAVRAGRSPDAVKVVAVSKTEGLEVIARASAVGIHEFGENRPDDLVLKQGRYPLEHWHFIGNIQSRRIKDIVGRACLIHSVDRVSLFERINARAEELDIVQDILLEVNVSGEESKSGFEPGQVEEALEQALSYGSIRVKGLMTMAPQAEDAVVRACFKGLRELKNELASKFGDAVDLCELSCGMSMDFAIGIEEGATIIRVGRRIFSEDFAGVSN